MRHGLNEAIEFKLSQISFFAVYFLYIVFSVVNVFYACYEFEQLLF